MYCMTMMGPVTTALRDAFEPLFAQYKVDVAFWGHIHVSPSSYCEANPSLMFLLWLRRLLSRYVCFFSLLFIL
jgi:hypothetical protein